MSYSIINIYPYIFRLSAAGTSGLARYIFLFFVLSGIFFVLGVWLGLWLERRQHLRKLKHAQRELEQIKLSKASNERLILKLEHQVQELEWDVYQLKETQDELENLRYVNQEAEERIRQLEQEISNRGSL